jgi:hypothetical protein
MASSVIANVSAMGNDCPDAPESESVDLLEDFLLNGCFS